MQRMAKSGNSGNGQPTRTGHAPGPYDGYRLGALDVPVRIFDLSVDGCLVELNFGTMKGRGIKIQIELPVEGWITVECETLHIGGPYGYAVKFIHMDKITRDRIEREIERIEHTSTKEGAPGNGEGRS